MSATTIEHRTKFFPVRLLGERTTYDTLRPGDSFSLRVPRRSYVREVRLESGLTDVRRVNEWEPLKAVGGVVVAFGDGTSHTAVNVGGRTGVLREWVEREGNCGLWLSLEATEGTRFIARDGLLIARGGRWVRETV